MKSSAFVEKRVGLQNHGLVKKNCEDSSKNSHNTSHFKHSMKLSDPLLLADGTLHPAGQSAIGQQQWITEFHCVFEVL